MPTARRAEIDADGVVQGKRVAREPRAPNPQHIPLTRAERGHKKYNRVRSITPIINLSDKPPVRQSLIRRAMQWCLPWGIWTYPGHTAGSLAILGSSRSSYYLWASLNNAPSWALLRAAEYIEARCARGMALVTELRAAAEMAVDGRSTWRANQSGLKGRPPREVPPI